MSSDPQKKRERIESAIMEQLIQRFGDAGISSPSQVSQAALLHSLRYLLGTREHRGILYGETAPFILTTAEGLEEATIRFAIELLYEYESKRSYLARGFRRYSLRAIAQDASQSDLGGIAGEYGETANDALLWAFQAKRVQPQTSARRAEFDIADPILVENVDPDYSSSIASFVRRGKSYNFEYFVSYRDLVRRGLALDADKQGDSIQGGDLFEEAQQPRLFNPRRRVTNHDPRAAAWEVSRR